MPELPEVETTRQTLLPLLGKQFSTITVYQPSLRELIPASFTHIAPLAIHRIERRAKYLIFNCGDITLLAHLGMSGSFRLCSLSEERRRHDHVVFSFDDLQLRYHDPRRFGFIVVLNDLMQQKYLNQLGIEPLDDHFTGDYLQQHLSKKQCAIKTAIMDQRIVVGVGNIYASEALFLAKIHPLRSANTLATHEYNALCHHIKAVLNAALLAGGSSINDYVNGKGETGYFQQTLNVYGRMAKPCLYCQTPITRTIVNQRSTFFCKSCQT